MVLRVRPKVDGELSAAAGFENCGVLNILNASALN
jgi:hypothetical protein